MKKATKRELIVATMISRMVGTSVFSDRTEFSVATNPKMRQGKKRTPSGENSVTRYIIASPSQPKRMS